MASRHAEETQARASELTAATRAAAMMGAVPLKRYLQAVALAAEVAEAGSGAAANVNANANANAATAEREWTSQLPRIAPQRDAEARAVGGLIALAGGVNAVAWYSRPENVEAGEALEERFVWGQRWTRRKRVPHAPTQAPPAPTPPAPIVALSSSLAAQQNVSSAEAAPSSSSASLAMPFSRASSAAEKLPSSSSSSSTAPPTSTAAAATTTTSKKRKQPSATSSSSGGGGGVLSPRGGSPSQLTSSTSTTPIATTASLGAGGNTAVSVSPLPAPPGSSNLPRPQPLPARRASPPTGKSAAAAESSKSNAAAAAAATAATNSKNDEDNRAYCVCRTPWDSTDDRPMIGCDGEGCEDWFHPECLGFQGMEKRGANVLLVDADGVKIDATEGFLCPLCELKTKAPLPDRARLTGSRLVALCEGMDWADEGSPVPQQSSAVPPATATSTTTTTTGGSKQSDDAAAGTVSLATKLMRHRWRALADARTRFQTKKTTFAPCASCQVPHHPSLPCASTNRPESCLEPVTPTPRHGKFAPAVVKSGKYQGRTVLAPLPPDEDEEEEDGGEGLGISPWIQLVDRASMSAVSTPEWRLHYLPPFFDADRTLPPEDVPENLRGVVRLPGTAVATYEARLEVREGVFLPLGVYSTVFRAARVHDVAARLQWGDDTDLVNFPTDAVMDPDVRSQPAVAGTRWIPRQTCFACSEDDPEGSGVTAGASLAAGDGSTSSGEVECAIDVANWCDAVRAEHADTLIKAPQLSARLDRLYAVVHPLALQETDHVVRAFSFAGDKVGKLAPRGFESCRALRAQLARKPPKVDKGGSVGGGGAAAGSSSGGKSSR